MRSGFRNFRDFRKLYLGGQIFPYYFGDSGLQRYPLSTKDFCNFFIGLSIWNRPFFCWFIFPFLGIWTGRVQTETNKKHYKILGTDTNTLFGGGLLLRTGILAYFNVMGLIITLLTLRKTLSLFSSSWGPSGSHMSFTNSHVIVDATCHDRRGGGKLCRVTPNCLLWRISTMVIHGGHLPISNASWHWKLVKLWKGMVTFSTVGLTVSLKSTQSLPEITSPSPSWQLWIVACQICSCIGQVGANTTCSQQCWLPVSGLQACNVQSYKLPHNGIWYYHYRIIYHYISYIVDLFRSIWM